MVVLYVFFAIFLAVVLLLITPVRLKVSVAQNFDFAVFFGPFKILKSEEEKPHKSKKSKDNDAPKKEGFIKTIYKEKGFAGAVLEIFAYLKIIFSELGYFLGKIKIRDFVCAVTVSDDDAATTAVSYGLVSTAVYGFTGYLSSATDLKIKNILVDANYSENKGSFELKFTVKIKLLYLLIVGFRLIKKFIKYKREV